MESLCFSKVLHSGAHVTEHLYSLLLPTEQSKAEESTKNFDSTLSFPLVFKYSFSRDFTYLLIYGLPWWLGQ